MQMRQISKCLNSKLSHICLEAIKLEELSHLGSFRAGKLILITASSAWATSLRYFAPELRDTLRSKGKLHQLTTVEIKVQL